MNKNLGVLDQVRFSYIRGADILETAFFALPLGLTEMTPRTTEYKLDRLLPNSPRSVVCGMFAIQWLVTKILELEYSWSNKGRTSTALTWVVVFKDGWVFQIVPICVIPGGHSQADETVKKLNSVHRNCFRKSVVSKVISANKNKIH